MPLNITNVKRREKDIIKTTRGKTNKVRKTSIAVDRLITRGGLLQSGWSSREVTQLKRYVILKNEYGTLSREYSKTLENLEKQNFAPIIDKAKTLRGSSILLKNDLLLNVLEKSRMAPTASQLADKLKQEFGEVLTKYNINLDTILSELKEEVKITYQQFDIDRQDYSDYMESFSDVVGYTIDMFSSFFSRIKSYLGKLFGYQTELESILVSLESEFNQSEIYEGFKPYKSIYKESQFDVVEGNSFVKEFLEILSQIKLFHWQTFGYAQHIALGNYYDSLGTLVDSFVEEYQGAYGRESICMIQSPEQIPLLDYENQICCDYIDEVCIWLKTLRKNLESDNFNTTSLQNIGDEMIGATTKLKYLLTLK
jgi:hypothetical protein